MPIKLSQQINLLPEDGLNSSTFGRILKWALSSFRVMVIITELVVMAAFLSRFWLDSKNSDLNEAISINKAQVEAFSDVETEFRLKQKQMQIANTLYKEPKQSSYISGVTKYIPQNVILSSITLNDNVLLIKASSSTEESIAQFLINLESYKEIGDINLSQLSSSTDNGSVIAFTVSAKIK